MSDTEKKAHAGEGADGDAGGGGESNNAQITLKVAAQDGNEVHFKVKRNTQLGKLMKAYADRAGSALSSLKFLFDGQRIAETATPKMLEMDDNDIIEVYAEQVGGN